MNAENIEKRLQKPLFTSSQVFAELNNQGILSIKGESGAFYLYKNIFKAYNNGDQIITSQVIRELV